MRADSSLRTILTVAGLVGAVAFAVHITGASEASSVILQAAAAAPGKAKMLETTGIVQPDLSSRPFRVTVERTMTASPRVIYKAWTEQYDQWFAAPGTLLMKPEVNVPYFFETRYNGERHPHYGRFIKLEADRLIVMTWINAAGTQGAETVLTVELTPRGKGTHLRLTHEGLPDEESKKGHEEGWALALTVLDDRYSDAS